MKLRGLLKLCFEQTGTVLEGQAELKSVYNEIPDSYDRANSIISFYQDKRWRNKLIKMLLSLEMPRNALDVGAGKGELSEILKLASPETEIVMVDYAENMIRSSKYENRVIASFSHLPFRASSFDMVMSSFALHAADDVETVVSEMARVSRNVVGALAMGKPDSGLFRTVDGLYLNFVQPNLAALAGGKPEHFRYIYYIYKRNPKNSEIKSKISKHVDLVVFKEMALNSFYLFAGFRRP